MQLPRSIGLVDLAVITIILVMVVLPPREMYARAAVKGDEPAQFALSLAEAKTMAHPSDGTAAAELAQKLGDGGLKDWAIEAALSGARRAKGSPSEWRALLAASVAYVDHIDVVPALELGQKALTTCQAVQAGCPTWEELRMTLYTQHLEAGVKSGIDPRRDPKGFRAAGEAGVRTIRLNSSERESGGGSGSGK